MARQRRGVPLLALLATGARAGCSQAEPSLCWLFGSRQHCRIRGVGDREHFYPLMVAVGCPGELRNASGGGSSLCTACEAMVKNPPAGSAQPYNVGAGEAVYLPPNFDCESCLPETREVLTCRLGTNWRYCDAASHPGLREAMASGCGDPTGPCTFWRSAIEDSCPLPFDCPATDAQPLVAVVAACSSADAPMCAGLTPNAPGNDNGYNAERPAWVLGPNNYHEDLVGGVPTQPRSRVARGIY